jgi:UDP-N-acetylmuramoyl-tripeptide--D-alanyl-D-alanine ligase
MTYQPNNNRSQLTQTAHNQVICDFYNANPSSMEAALKNLAVLTAEKKVAIIGDMFEMGEESPAQHDRIATVATGMDNIEVIFIGKDFYAYREKYKGQFFLSPKEAEAYLKETPLMNCLVLLKGSRGMALEQLLPLL